MNPIVLRLFCTINFMCESGTQESFFVTVICESVTVSETLTEAESSIVISSGTWIGNLHLHSDLLLVNHNVADIKHHGQVIVEINYASVFSCK